MRVRRTRAEQVEDNRARLMSAARKVFVKKGFHGASLDDVARAAGLTKGAVYARFASKAELMLALIEERVDARAKAITTASGRVRRSGKAVAEAIAREWADLLGREREWSLLVLEFRVHAARDRALNARFRAAHARLRAAIAASVGHTGVDADEAEGVARIAMALAHGFALEKWVDEAVPDELLVRASVALARGM